MARAGSGPRTWHRGPVGRDARPCRRGRGRWPTRWLSPRPTPPVARARSGRRGGRARRSAPARPGAMPGPWSETSRHAVAGSARTRTSMGEPAGVCCSALASRLSTTWRSRSASPTTADRSRGLEVDGAIRGAAGRAASTAAATMAVRSTCSRARGAGGRDGPAAAGRRRARSCGWPPRGCGASRWRGPRDGHARRGRTARRSPGSTSTACATRARRRPGTAAAAPRRRRAPRRPPRCR